MKSFLFLTLIFLQGVLYSQKKLVFENSADILEKGVGYFSEKKYYEAIQQYKKVSINDTNYAVAQYEMARSYYGMELYPLSQQILQELINYNIRFDFKHKVYSLLGLAFQENGQPEKALETFNKGLELFPKQQGLYFNRALTHQKMKAHDLALADFKTSLECNMFFGNAHLQLGLVAANEGQFAQATLSLVTFLLLEPDDSRAGSVVKILEQIASGSYEQEAKNISISPQQEKYDELNLFIKNKIALESNYKTKFTIPSTYGKQLHLILSNLKYEKSNPDFWNQRYMPFYTRIWEEKKIDPLIMYTLKGINNDDLQATLKSQSKKLEAFIEWAKTSYRSAIADQYILFEGKVQFVNVEYDPSYFKGVGIVKEDNTPIGNFYYYHPNGSKRMNCHFDDAGNPSGTWEIFNMYNGFLERKIQFSNGGKEKLMEQYYFTGELFDKRRIVNDLAEDTIYTYFRNGSLKEKYAVSKGKKEGLYLEYFPNGTLEYSIIYKNDAPEGPVTSYHPNGQKRQTFSLKGGSIDGKKLSYYPSGQLEQEYVYTEGLYNGEYVTYFSNGKVSEKGSYKNGKQIGELKEYYSNGAVSYSGVLDESGKQNGTFAYYDLDGKKYHEFHFSKGDLTSITFIDKTGKSTEIATKKGKKVDYLLNYPNGSKKIVGQYVDSEKNGDWKYYDNYGNLERTEIYKKGVISDSLIRYHSNGKVASKTTYVDGERNGVFLRYNIFGILTEEGVYKNDQLDKEWYTYFDDGKLKYESYYVDGDLNGIQKTYGVNGKLASWEEYDVGRVITHVFLDTNEKTMDQFREYDGIIELHNPIKSYINFRGSYKNGNSDGPVNWFLPNNVQTTRGQYINSERSGEWKWYHPNGKLEEVAVYINGELDGKRTNYHDNGAVNTEFNYENGTLEGQYNYYHPNGKQHISGQYLDGDRQGKISYFSPQGSLALIRNYDRDKIISYTYHDATGKEVTPIVLEKQDMKIVSYFKNGKKSNEHLRRNGLVEGLYLAYHDNGQKWEEENFKYGEAHGKTFEYNESGQKIREADYLYGNRHGSEKFFYSNGKLKSEQEFLYDSAHGKHIQYSPEGKVISITLYYNNEIVSIQTF